MTPAELPFDLALLAAAVASTRQSLIITDHIATDDPIIFCNPAFERMTGYNRQEIIGRNCRFLQGNDHDQPALEVLRTAIREERECTVVLRNYQKNGSAFRNELVISPVRSVSGQVTHLIGIQRDLTTVVPGREVTDQFLHDWRTPLTVLKLTIQLMQLKGQQMDPAFFTESLASAIVAIEKMEKLGR